MFPLEIQPKAKVRFAIIIITVLRTAEQNFSLLHLLQYYAQHSCSKVDADKTNGCQMGGRLGGWVKR